MKNGNDTTANVTVIRPAPVPVYIDVLRENGLITPKRVFTPRETHITVVAHEVVASLKKLLCFFEDAFFVCPYRDFTVY